MSNKISYLCAYAYNALEQSCFVVVVVVVVVVDTCQQRSLDKIENAIFKVDSVEPLEIGLRRQFPNN